jgi:hypothetical protein
MEDRLLGAVDVEQHAQSGPGSEWPWLRVALAQSGPGSEWPWLRVPWLRVPWLRVPWLAATCRCGRPPLERPARWRTAALWGL